MSSTEDDSAESLIGVARAVRTRGLKGEIVAELLTDFPERFDSIERMIGLSPAGAREVVELESFWFQKGRIILKLARVDTPEAAQRFVGYDFCIRENERVPLAEDEFYDFELEGCCVRDLSGREVGEVQSVLKTGGAEILSISAPGGKEILVPLAASIVVEIDTVGKKILIDPPEGLLELS